ncbi:MAG: phosphatidylglycerophosphatase A [Xanthomonadales bacterium]|nr:phosphatidylglycerophosphatase A [Xanthomonadales bacterium]
MKTAEPSREKLREVALTSPVGFLAFGFGSGLAPKAPGTFGTLAAVPFVPLLLALPLVWQLVAVATALITGVWICEVASKRLGAHDHGGIVWDEIAAYWLCVLFIPYQWPWLLAAFVIFRFFDIIKPWPIGWADKKVSGGLGIMLDDVLAAIWTIAILRLGMYYLS